ncbi:Cytochrome p450 [Thalictrum thalictroides]|uniref:Cytochrome p450 n=1 Tax=Thalictrum thalictroides TaxID=46969 RepID=A0A7J6WJI0_THATH|nr:Cytochrome p450 [Thalictrum thalictroides]
MDSYGCIQLSVKPFTMDSFHQCIAVIFSCVFASLLLLWKKIGSVKSRGRTVPEPVGAWPIIGHLHMLQPPVLQHILFASLADKYGPIFALRIGLRKTLVVSDSEVAKECFTTHDRVFANRPNLVVYKIMGYNNAMIGAAPYGPYWRGIRKIAILELLSNRRVELLKQVRIMEINTSIQEFYQLWATESKNGKGAVLVEDMKGWFVDLTLNITVRMVAGKRYFGESSKEDKEEARQIQKVVKDFFYLFAMFVVSDAIPFLGWLDIQGHVKAMKRTAKEIDSILGRWLDEHKQKKLDKLRTNTEDFMDVLLSVVQDENLFGLEADIINKATCLKAQNEIDIHVGKDRYVEESDIQKLVYLQAIVKETLRLYPSAPIVGPHESMEDCTVSGYNVPKGTGLLVNISKIQRDPRIWCNPCEFKPERFLTTQANVDVRGQHFEFLPFGSGRRSCPGISFALQVVHLALARLLQGFDFETPLDAPVDMTESVGLTNLKGTPLEVLITPRLPSHLY